MTTTGTIRAFLTLLALSASAAHAGGAFMFGGSPGSQPVSTPAPAREPERAPAQPAVPTLVPLPTAKPAPALGTDTNQLVATARGGLFLRSAPNGKKLGLIANGTAIDPTGRERDGWVEVEVRGRKGWVNSDYVTEGTYCADGSCAQRGGFTSIVESLVDVVRNSPIGSNSALSYASHVQKYLKIGYGVGRNKCWRAVWNVLRAAGMVRGELTQNSAKNALIDLRKFGFRHDPNACNRPGVVRVYGSTSVPVARRSRTAGDTHGHIEILGTDRRYHHFTSSKSSIQARFGKARRPLKYCLVKTE